MRYLLLFIFTIVTIFTNAQQVNPVTDYTFANKMSSGRSTVTDTAAYFSVGPRYGAVRGMMPPIVVDTAVVVANKRNGLLIFSVQKNKMQVWDSAGSKWADLTGSTGSAITSADTAAMLLPYLRKTDTTAMLAPYLKESDTAFLSNRINLKVNISDTASMLSPYMLGSGTANYLPKFNASRSIVDSKVYETGTNLMFNTTSPYISSSGYGTFDINGSTASVLVLRKADTARGYWSHNGSTMDINNLSAGDIRFYTQGSLRGRFQTDGTFRLNSLTGTGTRSVVADANGVLSASSTPTDLIDTTYISTRAWRQKGDDSLGAIIATKGSGTVTSVATGYGLFGGTITTTGTISADTALIASRLRVGKVVDSLALVKQNVLTNPVTGTGTTNYVPKFTGTSTIGNSIIRENGIKIGINRNPVVTLDVQDTGVAYIRMISGNSSNQGASLLIQNVVNGGTTGAFGDRASLIGGTPNEVVSVFTGFSPSSVAVPLTFDIAASERARFNGTGELLLNTTTDAGDYKLQVSGATYLNNPSAVALQIGGGQAIRTTGTLYTDFGTSGTGDYVIRSGSGFSTAFTVTNSSNIGIGTSTPGVRLDMGVTANQAFGIKTNTSNYLYAGTFNDFAILGVNRNPSTGAFSDANKAAADIAIEGASGNANIRFETSASNGSTPTERLRVHANGGLKFVGQSAAPTAEAGTVYYDTDDNKLKVYNGTTWVDLH
jgi:hypothetical protein